VGFDWALWLPDGKRIVFSAAEKDRASRLYVRDLQGGKEQPISPEGVTLQDAAKTVSPDSKSVLVFSGNGKASLFPIEGGDPRPVAGLNPGTGRSSGLETDVFSTWFAEWSRRSGSGCSIR